eukprot:TRINITY_DN18952_c0_g1_i3.p1 TRINITY_DN18952_c0_g1~~TRINITY_DN18952_c0_g1_i3.p1  ORF type:complete len:786 (-),score=106.22 TRINITY_DN18952_c0_g1_i3:60-2384(-)
MAAAVAGRGGAQSTHSRIFGGGGDAGAACLAPATSSVSAPIGGTGKARGESTSLQLGSMGSAQPSGSRSPSRSGSGCGGATLAGAEAGSAVSRHRRSGLDKGLCPEPTLDCVEKMLGSRKQRIVAPGSGGDMTTLLSDPKVAPAGRSPSRGSPRSSLRYPSPSKLPGAGDVRGFFTPQPPRPSINLEEEAPARHRAPSNPSPALPSRAVADAQTGEAPRAPPTFAFASAAVPPPPSSMSAASGAPPPPTASATAAAAAASAAAQAAARRTPAAGRRTPGVPTSRSPSPALADAPPALGSDPAGEQGCSPMSASSAWKFASWEPPQVLPGAGQDRPATLCRGRRSFSPGSGLPYTDDVNLPPNTAAFREADSGSRRTFPLQKRSVSPPPRQQLREVQLQREGQDVDTFRAIRVFPGSRHYQSCAALSPGKLGALQEELEPQHPFLRQDGSTCTFKRKAGSAAAPAGGAQASDGAASPVIPEASGANTADDALFVATSSRRGNFSPLARVPGKRHLPTPGAGASAGSQSPRPRAGTENSALDGSLPGAGDTGCRAAGLESPVYEESIGLVPRGANDHRFRSESGLGSRRLYAGASGGAIPVATSTPGVAGAPASNTVGGAVSPTNSMTSSRVQWEAGAQKQLAVELTQLGLQSFLGDRRKRAHGSPWASPGSSPWNSPPGTPPTSPRGTQPRGRAPTEGTFSWTSIAGTPVDGQAGSGYQTPMSVPDHARKAAITQNRIGLRSSARAGDGNEKAFRRRELNFHKEVAASRTGPRWR